MPLYTRIKLGRNLWVRPTSRGLRFSAGPRAARVHFGAGRTAISTGTGPFTYYQRIGDQPSAAARTTGGLTAAKKADDARQIADALQRLFGMHRAEYPAATAPQAPQPEPIDGAAIDEAHRKAALTGIGFFARAQRRAAKLAAQESAQREIAARTAEQEQRREAHQAQLDAWWQELLANEPGRVHWALDRALADNRTSAVVLQLDGGAATVRVTIPDPDVLPDRLPSLTQAGNLSLRRANKTEAAELYRLLVAGIVLTTVKESLAVAPGLTSMRVIAVRRTPEDAYGHCELEPLLDATIARDALQGIEWAEHDAWVVLTTAAPDLTVHLKGVTKQLSPIQPADGIDLTAEAVRPAARPLP